VILGSRHVKLAAAALVTSPAVCRAQVLDFYGKPLVIEPSPGQLSSDAGLLPIRQFDEGIGLRRAYAEAVDGPRAAGLPEHSPSERARARVVGILAGCQDWDGHGNRLDPELGTVLVRAARSRMRSSRASVGHTSSSSCHGLRRVGHIVLRAQAEVHCARAENQHTAFSGSSTSSVAYATE
jgi:hypothetical protein